jgi:peroxiredoxin
MTSPSTIAQRVAELHATMAAEPPVEAMGAFAREQAELAASGLPAGIAPAGTVLPDAELLDLHGTPTTLYAAAGGGTSVLVFYRGAWCLTGPSEEARPARLQLGLDLASVNADGTVTLPMLATVILDASRTVRWIDVHPDYSTRTESRQVISALDHLGL